MFNYNYNASIEVDTYYYIDRQDITFYPYSDYTEDQFIVFELNIYKGFGL